MSERVVATEHARAAAQQLQQIVRGPLTDEIRKLRAIGQTLCDPSNWDGPQAQQFRTQDWPQMSRTMASELEELGKLSISVPKIIQDILKAGNEGGGAQGEGEAQSKSTWDKFLEHAVSFNRSISWVTKPIAVGSMGAMGYNAYRYFKAVREYPALARSLFSDAVGETALAYDRGGATLQELEQAAALGMRRTDAAYAFTRVADFRKLSDGSLFTIGRELKAASYDAANTGEFLNRASVVFKTAARLAVPLAIAGDVLTIIHPGVPGAEGKVLQGFAGVNLAGQMIVGADMAGLIAADSALGWIPVAGQIIVVASAVVLVGDWAYHTFPGFHSFVDKVADGTVSVAKDVWHGISSAASSTGHFFSHLF